MWIPPAQLSIVHKPELFTLCRVLGRSLVLLVFIMSSFVLVLNITLLQVKSEVTSVCDVLCLSLVSRRCRQVCVIIVLVLGIQALQGKNKCV